MSILELSNVSYAYKNNKDKKILNNISTEFEEGVFYAILGTSGSGKTTLLSLLAGLDEPQAGEVRFAGEDLQVKGYRNHRKNQISLVFQNYNLIDYMTPMENLKLANKQADKQILLDFGLEEQDINRNVLQLSGGQQQRVAIARALVADVPIILADEPTGNLDEETADDIIEVLKDSAHRKGKCVIVVTHSKHLADQADVVLQLKNQKLMRK
ncbi:ABC transporter ATP-binding protein [Paenibacillus endoradicis]|uniref:ABC transporter ATP-binding protein n=1 Tax=Paenibacillus endoradicis TaxID=2972487 RepID=UPI002158DFBC|nr:ABC transporter ATP-binding protein [Paenibacillus endoradicis]MCR8658528.1 ABC transporter ATP-binding protein [Paenibacillus endoradicis]